MSTRICAWCSQDYTVEQHGRGQPSPYCSPECKKLAQNALAAGRMRRMREGRRDPFYRPKHGWPSKGEIKVDRSMRSPPGTRTPDPPWYQTRG